MFPSKDEIKDWLKRFNHTREWLGERCGKSKGTVNNWLSTNIEISPATLNLIARLMDDDARAEAERQRAKAPNLSHVTLRITTDELNEWSRAFKASDAETLEDWALQVIRDAYQSEQEQKAPEETTPSSAPGDKLTLEEEMNQMHGEHKRRESPKTRPAKFE